MSEDGSGRSVERLIAERDLYRSLLELGAQVELEPLLEQALALIVRVTGAGQGYLEMYEPASGSFEPSWWISHGCSEEQLEDIRRVISRGIISEALSTGEIIVTPSAVLDPRFRERASVKAGSIDAVLCAPIGGVPPLGALYLQGRSDPGPFDSQDIDRVQLFAQQLLTLADRLLLRRRESARSDPVALLRSRLRLEGVIGRSRALAEALRQVELLAGLDVHVLITGATGTGKSQLARVLHDNSARASGPYVEINCAALPETLLESELFGAERGAHSTATHAVSGKVAAAEGGTLVLDEIAELSSSGQAKVLQLLQSHEYFPLGSNRLRRADVRVIAVTNRDLEAEVRQGQFREDLYYRLEVLPIRMPTLAERRDDLCELGIHLCERACERHRLRRLELSPGALSAIEQADWPGNVRQLANAIEAATVRAAGENADRVEQRHVFPGLPSTDERAAEVVTFQEATRRFQRSLLLRTLEETGWKITETARRLDLARSHVYNLIRAFRIRDDDK